MAAESIAFKERDWQGQPEELHRIYNSDAMASISRYETSLERNFYKALHELQRIQAMRLGQGVTAPIVIDV